MKIRDAPFGLRVVRRRTGTAAVVYRRLLTNKGHERLTKIAPVSPMGTSAGSGLFRAAVRAASGTRAQLSPGPFLPLDADWGARVACYALIAHGLTDPVRLRDAAENLRNADAAEAAWWLGLMTQARGSRAVRALRILTEAVQ